MKLQKAQRKHAKIKMALQGPSGSGKTMSALLLAYGLCQDWSKIAVIDTENHSSELYAHLGEFLVLSLSAPFTPERYMEAIQVCEKSGVSVIILDSITQEWETLLDYHSSLTGNSFTNWSKITPRHNEFIRHIVQSTCHVIATIRTKQDYVLSEKNGKMVPEKVGLKSVQRENVDYEFTLVFDLDIRNNASASKDRTGLFFGKPERKITHETGRLIAAWCTEGSPVAANDVIERIKSCQSLKDLLAIYYQFPQYSDELKPEFETRKQQLQSVNQKIPHQLNPVINPNGKQH
jgi:hypothetical protein